MSVANSSCSVPAAHTFPAAVGLWWAGEWPLDELAPFVWPLSYTSAPQWTCCFFVLMLHWFLDFCCRAQPALVTRAADAQRKKIGALQAAAVQWHAAEVKKGKDGLPEVSRLVALLHDEIAQQRTDATGPLEHTVTIEALLKRALTKELRKAVRLTRDARFGADHDQIKNENRKDQANATDPLEGGGADEDEQSNGGHAKALAAHASGEKLSEAVAIAEDVRRRLGKRFVDVALLAEARALAARVFRAQSSNRAQLLGLIRPALPLMAVGGVAAMVNCALRGYFHSIGGWASVLELAAAGERAASIHAIFALWLGHLFIECIERIDASYTARAQILFTRRIKGGVLAAMLAQDYAYFSRNEPGVLQDRLTRDSAELGENLVRFPQKMLHRVAWMAVNVAMIVSSAPRALLLPAFAPLLITVPLQYVAFRANDRFEQRRSKAEERAVASTSEVLREVKTVRQFAMEVRESCRHEESGGSVAHLQEQMVAKQQVVDWLFWSIFVSGLFMTMLAGLDFVESGAMRVSALLDIVFRINCHISFPLREIMDDVPRMTKLLRPLGRICDLLQTTPRIEPGALPSHVVARDAGELAAVISCCDALAPAGRASGLDLAGHIAPPNGFVVFSRSLPSALLPPAAAGGGGGVPAPSMPAKGSHVTALVAADGYFVRVHGKGALEALARRRDLAFPVRVLFSKGLRPPRFRGKIEFRNVTWAPPTDCRKTILNGLSFTVNPGEKVALVGPTGCGKSSAMALLQRLYEPDSGQILVDDQPIQDYDIHHYRSRVVIVDQSTVLFNASIRANITYGLTYEPSDEEVIQACRDAKAWDFIQEKPDGLMTAIHDGGKNLSGGQRQRLAIARAMIRRPDVILLDEATSALDNENEAKVQEALDEFARRGSALVIAHRLSTIKDSDRICVIDRGVVVESGSHGVLLARAEAGVDAKADDAPANIAFGGADRPGTLQPSSATLDDALGAPPACSPSLMQALSTDSGTPRASSSPCGLCAPPMRRTQTESTASCGTSKNGEGTTYARLWHAATGDGGSKSLTQIAQKLAELEAEIVSLRRREATMLGIKNRLVGGCSISARPNAAGDGMTTSIATPVLRRQSSCGGSDRP